MAEAFTCQLQSVRPGVHALVLTGDLTAGSEAALLDAWLQTPTHETIILDLSGVTLMNGQGLGGITALAARARERQQTLMLVGMDEQWAPVFDLTRLRDDLPAFGTIDDALQSQDPRQTLTTE
jgi:anti-anti-sigma factor